MNKIAKHIQNGKKIQQTYKTVKLGFMKSAAENGLTLSETEELLNKTAIDLQSLVQKYFGTGNQQVDLIALQSILGADPTLTQGDRNILISQARSAMRSSGGQSISIDRVKNMGLGMLAGYILSKTLLKQI